MEFNVSVEYKTSIGFFNKFEEIKERFYGDVCLILDKSLKDAVSILPKEKVFLFNSEKDKDLNHVENCIEWLIEINATRNTGLIVIGGGASTDFGSFVASVFNRGMKLILVPTTILAAVDSSIGGKTAVNFVAKNSVGTFYPANEVLIVREFFETLNEKMIASGKAEIIKIALIRGGELFEALNSNEIILSEENIKRSIKAKYDIISTDLTDTLKKRMVLNWGHTFGHAIERYYGLPHGIAVASGMVLMQKYAEYLGYQVFSANKLEELLKKHGIENDFSLFHKDTKWRKFIIMDKKRVLEEISMVYLKKIGEASMIKRKLNDILNDLEELR